MTWKTHIIGGAQIGIVLASVAHGTATDSAIIFSASMLGSVLPDIDHPRSKLARSDAFVGLLSRVISKFTKHRGFTHTIPGALLFALIFYALAMFRTEKESLIAFFAALIVFIAIHAMGDALRWLAGWVAVAVYMAGPQVASLIRDHNIDIGINSESARLCALGIFAGCVIHMVYDSFNSGGIQWLYPISRKNIRLLAIKTNTLGELGFIAMQILVLSAIIAVCYKDVRAFEMLKEIVGELKTKI